MTEWFRIANSGYFPENQFKDFKITSVERVARCRSIDALSGVDSEGTGWSGTAGVSGQDLARSLSGL